MTSFLHMLTRLLHTRANPPTARHITPQHKIRSVGKVMLILELLGQLLRHRHHPIIRRIPLDLIKVHRQTQIKRKSNAIVVNTRIQQQAAGRLGLAVAVYALRLDVDGTDFDIVDIGEDGELDGAAPTVWVLDEAGVAGRVHFEDDAAEFVGVGEDVLGDFAAEGGCWVGALEDAAKGCEHAAVVVGHDAQS